MKESKPGIKTCFSWTYEKVTLSSWNSKIVLGTSGDIELYRDCADSETISGDGFVDTMGRAPTSRSTSNAELPTLTSVHAASCLLPPSTASRPLPPVHCLPSTASRPLPPVHCLPSPASHQLPVDSFIARSARSEAVAEERAHFDGSERERAEEICLAIGRIGRGSSD
jgi:hypothetical protein